MTIRRVLCVAMAAMIMAGAVNDAKAEELPLASEAEISMLGGEGAAIYAAAVNSLDRADVKNAFRHMARVALMAPDVPSVNELASVLAMKLGRSNPAERAKQFYDIAEMTSRNVLASPIADSTRRRVASRLRDIAKERSELDNRDAKRESVGNVFLIEYSRSFLTPTPTPQTRRAAPPPIPPGGQQQPGGNVAQFSEMQTGGEVIDTGAAGRGNYFGNPSIGRNPEVQF